MIDDEPAYSHCRSGDTVYLGPCSYPWECVTCGMRFEWIDLDALSVPTVTS